MSVAEKIALPPVYIGIKELLAQPEASIEDCADIILLDSALSSRLIKMVNNPFWGYHQKADTVQKAISMIGLFQLHDLLLSSLAIRAFSTIPTTIFDQKSFWRNSFYCGIAARMLAEKCMLETKERLFSAGLLHEIGHIVMFAKIPDKVQEILRESWQSNTPLFQQERQSLGFDYGQVGSEVMKLWQLPHSYCDIATNHIEPKLAVNNKIENQIINLARSIMLAEEQSLDQPLSLCLQLNDLINKKLTEQDVNDIQIAARLYVNEVTDCLWPFHPSALHNPPILNMRTEY